MCHRWETVATSTVKIANLSYPKCSYKHPINMSLLEAHVFVSKCITNDYFMGYVKLSALYTVGEAYRRCATAITIIASVCIQNENVN